MLKLMEVEFCKLRRKKVMWLMLLAAFVMPFFASLYFGYLGKTNIEPALFYKWSAFGCTMFLILPFVLGLLGIMLIHDENQNDMLKQLWIIPVSKTGYFFSKFFMVFLYSLCFMIINGAASVLFSIIPNYVAFEWNSIAFLMERCLEIAVLTSVAILPVFAVTVSQKGYIFPMCITLIYIFAGFFMTPVNFYLHPISCVSVIISRGGAIPGLTLLEPNPPLALFSMCVWGIASVILAVALLGKRR
ncbi:MAG: ABC transporter permease [Bacillota bacterium]|nr:ABC transporter permease [Bacillota bacterium]